MTVGDACGLGVGVVYTAGLARVLDLAALDVLEVEPQVYWRPTGDPTKPVCLDDAIFSRLRAMPQPKLVHSITLPIGNSRPHDPVLLECLRDSIALLDAPYASEHLSFNQFGNGPERQWTGFLLPPKQNEHQVMIAAERIDEMRQATRVPIAFETGVNYLSARTDELSDGRFFRAVAETADCGILLDLHNLLTNQRNGRESVLGVFNELPHERIWEIHLAGGMEYHGYWLDSHTGHIEAELFSIARDIVRECPRLQAIILEIMDKRVGEHSAEALRNDVKCLRSLWAERQKPVSVQFGPPRQNQAEAPELEAIDRHEKALGALTLGHVQFEADPQLLNDHGTDLYRRLVVKMREAVLYDSLPLLISLLLSTIQGEETTRLISLYCKETLPQQFASDEARQFLKFARLKSPAVPHLREVADFEDAIKDVKDGKVAERELTFSCNPETLLVSLVERRHVPPLSLERFYVKVFEKGILFRRCMVDALPTDGPNVSPR